MFSPFVRRSILPALLVASAIGCAAPEAQSEADTQNEALTALPRDYEKKSGLEKQALLWANMASDEYCKNAPPAAAHGPYDLRALDAWDAPDDDRYYYPPVQAPEQLAASTSQASYLTSECEHALTSGAAPKTSTMEKVKTLFSQGKAFDHSDDEIDAPRYKIVHVTGAPRPSRSRPSTASRASVADRNDSRSATRGSLRPGSRSLESSASAKRAFRWAIPFSAWG
jgi:hypothetical protein